MSDSDEQGGHMYEGEEAAAIQKEATNLQLLWNAYIELMANGNINVGLHPPPAFMAMYSALLDINQPLEEVISTIEHTTENFEALQGAMARIVAFGDAMFRFGQWCVSQGMLHANAIQCQCGTPTDDALKDVVDGGVKVDLSDDALKAWLEGGKGAQ